MTPSPSQPRRVHDDSLRDQLRDNLGRFERVSHGGSGLHHAAVAAVVVGDTHGRACFVITRRAPRLRAHAGQWALPGGRLDAGESAEEAALRELHEEVGLELRPDAVLGILDDYPTRSGYLITPVVVWAGPEAVLEANPEEVAEVHRVPLVDLERPEVPRIRFIPESDRPILSVPILETEINAPTAAVLYQLREVALLGRTTRVAHYDQPVFAWK